MKRFMMTMVMIMLFGTNLAWAETPNQMTQPVNTNIPRIESVSANGSSIFYVDAGTSRLLKLDFDVKNIAVGNSAVADVLIMGKRDLLINGKVNGVTTLTVWDELRHHDYHIVINKNSEKNSFKTYKLHNIALVSYKMEDPDKMILVKSEPIKETIKDLENILSGYLNTNQYSVSPWTNSIMVVGSDEDHKLVSDLIDKIDTKNKQVTFMVEVYEVKLENNLDFGLELLYQKDQSSVEYNKLGDGFKYTFSSGADFAEAANHVLKVMLSEGKAKLLATPKIISLDGRYSFIHAGEKIPLVQTDAMGNKSVEYLYTGVILGVVPNVDQAGDINCWIMTQVSSISGYDPDNKYPIIGTRETVNEIRMKNNGILILGGLRKDTENIITHKVPILGDLLGWIPVLGSIVKNEEIEKETSELVITLKPTVLFPEVPVAEVPQ